MFQKFSLIARYPIPVAATVVWTIWLTLMVAGDHWHLFADRWFMSVTMVFGSFIAGATSEGGGAVAFPVMTLLFEIPPPVARDFSLLIQAVGMTAASFTIIALRIPVEWRAVCMAGIGGAFGVVLGLDIISPLLTPAYTKLFFVSVWLSFAGALYWINCNRTYEPQSRIANFGARSAALLFTGGFLGGIVSGITGSGLDIITFAFLVLTFRVNEKIATPTSVVLMATNSIVAVFWREGITTGMAPAAWEFWYVCVPVVVIGAPVGAWFIRNRSRQFVVGFLYLSIICQYVLALALIPEKPFQLSHGLWAFTIATVATGFAVFHHMARLGGSTTCDMLATTALDRHQRQDAYDELRIDQPQIAHKDKY